MSEGQEKRKKGLEGKGDEGKGGSESKHQAVTPQQHAETTITERKDLVSLVLAAEVWERVGRLCDITACKSLHLL